MSIDRIGIIYDPGQAEGDEPVVLTGWHVNVTQDEIDANPDLAEFVVTPSRLRRVWAGDDCVSPTVTVALRFESEAQAEALLAPEPPPEL